MHRDVSLPSCSWGGSWQSQTFSHSKKQSEPRKDVNKCGRARGPCSRGEQDADCPCTPEMRSKDPTPADPMPSKQHLLVAKETLTTVRTVTGRVLWAKPCALCPQVRQGFPFCLSQACTRSHLKITYAAL